MLCEIAVKAWAPIFDAYLQVQEIFKQKGMLYATVTTGLDDGHA